jgi:acetyl-CoA/propionyl-CoA carboxylase biotin carboxyl carrier protein
MPAQLVVLDHPDFVAGEHSTNWVESDALDLTGVGGRLTGAAPESDDAEAEPKVRRDVDVEVNGKRFSVAMWVPESQLAAAPAGGGGGAKPRARRAAAGGGAGAAAGTGKIGVPMQGTIVRVEVAVGDHVEAGQVVCVLEAMKMENNVATDVSGTVAEVKVEPGQAVGAGDLALVVTPDPAD